MSDDTFKNKIRPIIFAFEYARAGMGYNRTTTQLEIDQEGHDVIVQKLRDMGQTRFINLTHRYIDATMSLALYAGDGIVSKVIPANFYDYSEPIHSMPPITSEKITAGDYNYMIETYPLLSSGGVDKDDVERLRVIMNRVGIDFSPKDDTPRNVHVLPDKNRTLTGIDADMFRKINNGKSLSAKLRESWKEYVHALYPVYQTGISPQTDDTNFDFISIHDKSTDLVEFDITKDDPIIRGANVQIKPGKGSFWRTFLSTSSYNDFDL